MNCPLPFSNFFSSFPILFVEKIFFCRLISAEVQRMSWDGTDGNSTKSTIEGKERLGAEKGKRGKGARRGSVGLRESELLAINKTKTTKNTILPEEHNELCP